MKRQFQCSSASRKFLNSATTCIWSTSRLSFSALQRAENSSMNPYSGASARIGAFQCSSASRKFLNHEHLYQYVYYPKRFSALQRAENSSIRPIFQMCRISLGFSALQRAENSSIVPCGYVEVLHSIVSVLFSEPKIPQSGCGARSIRVRTCFSALQRAENSSISIN